MPLEMFELDKTWTLQYTKRAREEFLTMDNTQQRLITNAIEKVLQNPLPRSEGGYGVPLSGELAGYLKIKILDAGIRVIYKLKREKDRMLVVMVGMRSYIYKDAIKFVREFRASH